ncbi:hypothetical protein D3C73_1036040 [compost metagenome]
MQLAEVQAFIRSRHSQLVRRFPGLLGQPQGHALFLGPMLQVRRVCLPHKRLRHAGGKRRLVPLEQAHTGIVCTLPTLVQLVEQTPFAAPRLLGQAIAQGLGARRFVSGKPLPQHLAKGLFIQKPDHTCRQRTGE